MSASGKLLSAVALLLSRCQPNSSGHSSVGAGEGRQLKGVPPFLIPPARTPPDSLALDFEVPAAVRAGDSVSLQVTLRNAVGRHLLLRLGGAPPHDRLRHHPALRHGSLEAPARRRSRLRRRVLHTLGSR